MPIIAECPECGHKGKVPDEYKGRKIKCRKCSKGFVVGGAAEPAAAAAPAAKAKSDPELGGLDFLGNAPAAPEDAANAFAELGQQEPEPPKSPKPKGKAAPAKRKPDADEEPAPRKSAASPKKAFKKKSEDKPLPIAAIIMGVLSLALGVAGLVIRNKGLAGLASVPLSGFGLLLALGGLLAGRSNPLIGMPVPAIASILCLIAAPLGGMQTYNLIASGALSVEEPAVQQTQTLPPTNPGQPASNPGPNNEPRPAGTPPSAPAGDQWADPNQGIRLGNAHVKIKKVEINPVPGKVPNKDKNLLIRLEIANLGNQGVDYFGWGVTERQGETPPTLTDDSGKVLKRIVYEKGQVEGQVDSQTIMPGKTLTDLLTFEVPADSIKYLRLELPASNLDGTGKLRFHIPRIMLIQPGPPR